MRKWLAMLVATVVVLGAFAATAAASIEVRPKRVALGEDVQFVVRIHSVWPQTNTQAVKVQFPEEITAPVFEAPPLGWSSKPLKSDNDTIVGVMYHGGHIPEGTYQDFLFIGRTASPGRTLWLAEQFYDNGVVARFSIDPAVGVAVPEAQADGLAAVVEIVGAEPVPSRAAPVPADSPPPASPGGQEFPPVVDDGGGGFGTAERLGLALLFVGLLAFVVVFVLSRTNAGFTPRQPSDLA